MSSNVFILMGVCGTGKSEVGKSIAQKTNSKFFDGDDFHSKENKKKMSNGLPLTDDDRQGWLEKISEKIKKEKAKTNKNIFFSCSALKQKYRDFLVKNSDTHIYWLFLHGEKELISKRLAERQKKENHFMKEGMLESQLEILELPQKALYLNISYSVEKIGEEILKEFKSLLIPETTI